MINLFRFARVVLLRSLGPFRSLARSIPVPVPDRDQAVLESVLSISLMEVI